MDALRLIGLLISSFGAFAYGAILVLWVRELGRLRWAGRRPEGDRGEVDVVNGILVIVSFAWFLLNMALLLMELGAQGGTRPVEIAIVFIAFFYPPLIMHTAWVETVLARHQPASRAWRMALWPAYIISLAIPAWCLLTFADPGASPALRKLAQNLLGAGLPVLFIGAAVYSVALVRKTSTSAPAREKQPLTALYALMVVLFAALFVLSFAELRSDVEQIAVTAVSIGARSLPLLFLFVVTYYENRFQFFDLFVKRGLALLATIAVLTLWFALLLPILTPIAATWAAPWIFAIALVPVVIAMPILYAALAQALDRRWLGRRFTTVEAVTRFLAGLRSATSQSALVERAEQGLSEIFNAPSAIRIGPGPDVPFDVRHETRRDEIRFVMGPRASDAPYFSQDAALLQTLADVFASALDNVQLQERRHDQEQRARELSLHASRSELKALRAQINPHFLFNALNAIAGLIHRDPAVADRTIEQLADVFRYTLRSADTEWARLDDELDFARAYLEVERARFGERLEVSFDVTPAALNARVPTMMLQTLVENAVKHGAATVRGHAVVGISARVDGARVIVAVTDNGPGFGVDTPDASAHRSGGYGLVNIRERLRGYFGDQARLSVVRDTERGLTVVSLTLPLVSQYAPQTAGASR